MKTKIRVHRVKFNQKVPITHEYSSRRIYVKKVTGKELRENDKFSRPFVQKDSIFYAECSAFGHIDWQSAKVFLPEDLIPRDNVFVIGP